MGSFRPDPNVIKKHPTAVTQQQIDERSRFLGTLLGAAAGESLGAPHENKSAAEVGSPRELVAGGPPTQSGALAWEDSNRKAAGNGSVMCCAPIGLLHVKNLDGLADDAAAASRITHYDPRCVAGCVAVSTAIALLVRGGKDAEEAIPRAASAAGAISDDVLMVIERGAVKKPDQLQVDGHDRGYVLHTLELAFSALAGAASLEEGLIAVVSR